MASGTSTDLEGRVGDGARGDPDAIDDESGDDDVSAEGKDVSSKTKGNHRCRGCRGRGVDGEEHIDDADDAGYGSSLMRMKFLCEVSSYRSRRQKREKVSARCSSFFPIASSNDI